MGAKQKPARVARGTGPENVAPVQKIDAPENTSPDTQAQPHPHPAALLAVREIVALGATFEILRRGGRAGSFIYRVPPGASDSDRERCRRIVADVKARGVLSTFVAAIAKLQGHQ